MIKNRLTTTPSRQQRKAALRQLLQERNMDAVETMAREDPHVMRVLPAMLFDREVLVCWRAIEALGKVAAVIGEVDLERVRVMIRAQLWQINDESGNVGWYAAEAIGEILYNVPVLIDEFGQLLLSYLDEEPFERGAHWAVARVASIRPDIYLERINNLLPSLESADAHIRAFALTALARIDTERAEQYAARLVNDPAAISYYDFDDGTLHETSVDTMVQS